MQRSVGVSYVDLAEFKAVNDLHGHALGDIVLCNVANRLRVVASDCDLIVRMGGDEFLVVKTAVSAEPESEQFARKLVEGLSGHYDLDGGEHIAIDALVGVAHFPADGEDHDALLAHAVTALRCAKRGGHGYALLNSKMQLEQHKRRAMERDIGLAIDRGELSVVFQPQVDAKSGSAAPSKPCSGGTIRSTVYISADFIPAAEASGAIIAIGAFVLREVCKEAAQWAEKLRVAVNVSAAQIVQYDFAHLVIEVLSETGLEPEQLEVEVTESLFIQDLPSAKATLRRIKDLGVSVAIDDFGNGYSSLSTLRAYPFDRIKVDRSFVADMVQNSDAAAIVNSVIGLGRAMGLRVVAEGVECQEQLALLRLLGCHEIQGYLFGEPLPTKPMRTLHGRWFRRTATGALPLLKGGSSLGLGEGRPRIVFDCQKLQNIRGMLAKARAWGLGDAWLSVHDDGAAHCRR